MDKLELFTTDELFEELAKRCDSCIFCSVTNKTEANDVRVVMSSGELVTIVGLARMASISMEQELAEEFRVDDEPELA